MPKQTYTCSICRFETEQDDAVVTHATRGVCVCLRCYQRETDSALPMPKGLRQDIIDALETAEKA